MQSCLDLNPHLVSYANYTHHAWRLELEAGQRQGEFHYEYYLFRGDRQYTGFCFDVLCGFPNLQIKLKTYFTILTRS